MIKGLRVMSKSMLENREIQAGDSIAFDFALCVQSMPVGQPELIVNYL